MSEEGMTYKEAGVDTVLGNEASEIFDNACKATYKNREGKIGEVIRMGDEFSGLRCMSLGGLAGVRQGANTDGIGTAVEIAQRIKKHDTMGYNLVAMCAEDASRDGGEPVWMTNLLDVNSLKGHLEYVRQLATGLVNAANEAGIAVINGEIAELGELVGGYGSFHYNWSASLNWVAVENKLIDGKSIKPGHSLVGLVENGFRSNGFTLIRRIMQKNYGDEWHEAQPELAEQIIERPTIYSGLIAEMQGKWNEPPKVAITGIVHVTGGGVPEKLGRLLQRTGYGAVVDNPFEPCGAMKTLQELGNVADREAYKTWNMGQGMIIVTPEPESVMEYALKKGILAQEMGIIQEEPKINIVSKGVKEPGKELVFPE